jgi:hypothetical protein
MKLLTLVLLSFLTFSASTQTITFFPENDLRRPETRSTINTEMEFEKAMSDIREIYVPLLQDNYAKTLNLMGDWSDDTVNAYTFPSEGMVNIQMFGGLFRHELTTIDGFLAVVCHELGHNIGGLPKYARYGKPEWAQNEGGSDYYAISKCTKKLFAKDIGVTLDIYDNMSENNKDGMYAKHKCDSVFDNEVDSAICTRSALAGLSLGKLLASLSGKTVSFQTPNQTKVTVTNVTGYPASQCRLDTYLQGALCNADFDILASETDPMVGYCNKGVGGRPECWYKY